MILGHHTRDLALVLNFAKMAGDENVSGFESEAVKRRQKLQQLKARRLEGSAEARDGDSSFKASDDDQLPKPVFRNYNPHDESLKERTIRRNKLTNLEEQVKEELEAAKTKPVVEGLDLTNLAPRKPDWDLKRDVSKKLEILERQTQRAIAELIRARLQTEDGDLAALVNMGVKTNENEIQSENTT